MASANVVQTSVSGGNQNALALQGDGVFLPKVDTASRLALTLNTSDKGFVVYDTTLENIFIWDGTGWESVPASGDAGANGAVQYNDNGIVAGAANFFWDKVNNRVGINNPTPSQALTVGGAIEATGGVAGQGALIGRDGGSGGATYGSNTGNTNVNAPAGGTVRFNVNNGVFAGLFDTSGNLGILNSSPFSGTSSGLTVGTLGSGPAKQIALQMANCYARMRERNVVNDFSITTNINVDNVLDDNTRPSWMMRLGAGTDLFSVFRAAAGSTTFATLATVNPVGDINLIGNLVPTNGKGIDFSATPQPAGATSELLNDYEEGTFTPAITGSNTPGTATYVGRNGKYTKIGNQVHVQIFIDWNSHTGTGDIRITGLPYTNGANFSGAVVGYANAITITAGYYLAAYVDAAQSYILLNQIPTGGGTNQTVPIDPAGTLVVSATYTV